MMAVRFAEAERVRTVGKLDAVQDLHADQPFDGAVHGGTPDPRGPSTQALEKVLGGEDGARAPEPDQAGR